MPSLAILISAILIFFRADRQTDRQTESEADDRYTHATTVGLITRYSLSAMASCTGSEQTSISLHFAQQ